MKDCDDNPEYEKLIGTPSHEWEEANPGHCYICHAADCDRCGPHCEKREAVPA
jgi:hypothetical protein